MIEDVRGKLDLYLGSNAVPVILRYGDTLWKKNWFGFDLLDLPGGREYCESAHLEAPVIKVRRGQKVTQDKHGMAFRGIGTIAANLTEVSGMDKYQSLKLILNADPDVAGIAFLTRKDDVLDWIDREDVTDL